MCKVRDCEFCRISRPRTLDYHASRIPKTRGKGSLTSTRSSQSLVPRACQPLRSAVEADLLSDPDSITSAFACTCQPLLSGR